MSINIYVSGGLICVGDEDDMEQSVTESMAVCLMARSVRGDRAAHALARREGLNDEAATALIEFLRDALKLRSKTYCATEEALKDAATILGVV